MRRRRGRPGPPPPGSGLRDVWRAVRLVRERQRPLAVGVPHAGGHFGAVAEVGGLLEAEQPVDALLRVASQRVAVADRAERCEGPLGAAAGRAVLAALLEELLERPGRMPDAGELDGGAGGDRGSDQPGATAALLPASDVDAGEVVAEAGWQVTGPPAVVAGVEARWGDLPELAVDEPQRPVEVQQVHDRPTGPLPGGPQCLDLLAGAAARRAVAGVRVDPIPDPAARAGNPLAGPRGGHDRAPSTRQSGQRPPTTPAE